MTLERRCSVEPSDVLAVTFECGSCGAAYRVPLNKLDHEGVANFATANCGYCGKPSGFDQRNMDINALTAFAKSLKTLSSSAQGRNLKLKMELACADLEVKP